MPMPWSVAARQRSMCKRFVRLFQLVQFMVNSAFRSLFLSHMATLTEIVEPGTISQIHSNNGDDKDFDIFESIDSKVEGIWIEEFVRAFMDVEAEQEERQILADSSAAASLSATLISKLYQTGDVLMEEELSTPRFKPDISHLTTCMNQFSKSGTISQPDFILATRKYLAEKAKIRCFFQFEVTVDLEQSHVFPSPDVEEWIDTLHRTNMSVMYVLANFKPIKKHFMVEPYVRMSVQGEEEEPEEVREQLTPRR